MIATLFFVLLLVGLGVSLLPTWMFLNSLQLIVHTPLLQSYLPANVHYFSTSYLGYMGLNSLSIPNEGLSDSASIDVRDPFTKSLVIVISLFALQIVILAILKLFEFIQNKTCKTKKRGLKQASKATWMVNFSIRYVYEFFIEMCLFVCIQIAVTRQGHELT